MTSLVSIHMKNPQNTEKLYALYDLVSEKNYLNTGVNKIPLKDSQKWVMEYFQLKITAGASDFAASVRKLRNWTVAYWVNALCLAVGLFVFVTAATTPVVVVSFWASLALFITLGVCENRIKYHKKKIVKIQQELDIYALFIHLIVKQDFQDWLKKHNFQEEAVYPSRLYTLGHYYHLEK